MKLINMNCTNCGAELQIDPERKQVYCTYCGTKLLLDDDTIKVTSRYVDEARLKEAEVRLKELEYEHERELRAERLLQEQKKSYRFSIGVYLAALLVSYVVPGLRTYFILVLVFGAIALLFTRTGDKRNVRSGRDYSSSPKSRLTALLLCVFVGIFGIHYFYVRRVGMGILYLITFGFFGIGWMIDIIRIACGIFTDSDGLYLKEL